MSLTQNFYYVAFLKKYYETLTELKHLVAQYPESQDYELAFFLKKKLLTFKFCFLYNPTGHKRNTEVSFEMIMSQKLQNIRRDFCDIKEMRVYVCFANSFFYFSDAHIQCNKIYPEVLK